MFDEKKLNEIFKKYNLQSLDALLLVHCAFKGTGDHLELLHSIITKLGKIDKKYIQELIDKKVIDGKFIKNIDNITFGDIYLTDEFRDQYYVDVCEAGEELWEAYPNTTIIDGRSTILKKGEMYNGTYMDKDFLIKFYYQSIQFDKKKHEEILDLVKKARELGLINFAIRNFILGKLWESLPELIGTSSTYDNRQIV